ncbi:E2 ligase fold family C protein [Flavisphingomonas formosensis]|uniref:E2 ligase fold family C protein n=1 Tax=Flavisphingomonas formosensis TaxID=861534 RepID=UPI0012F78453|nr:E2 ligase fold family C protein [Sphingomonas formosensis]
MALANFIDRAVTSASQLLADFELQPFRESLERNVVGIAFDADASGSSEAIVTLDLTLRLVARLYPRIAILGIGASASELVGELEELARSINPDIEFVAEAEKVTVGICVGVTDAPFASPTFHVGSDGWRARLSVSGPVGSGSSGNPVGAGAAACFAAANVFRTIFASQLTHGDIDEEIDLCLLSFAPGGGTDGAGVEEIYMGRVQLVGAGAIGNAFLWTASRWTGLSGAIDVVDHEDVDLSNLQRYVLCLQEDVSQVKVDVAVARAGSPSVAIVPHRADWQGYVSDRTDWRFDRVAVALDTARDRLAVQGSLPRWIANAWTQETDLGVSRHRFGDGACLACLYMPAGKVKDRDEIVAEELGTPEARLEIRMMLHRNAAVDAAFVGRVATALGVPFEPLSAFVGQPLASFHQGAICGGLVLKLTGGAAKVKAVVPMAFQSALAGILLAAEVVKHAAGLPPVPTTSTRINLLRPLGGYLHDPKSRDATGRCICADDDFLKAYAGKYGRG